MKTIKDFKTHREFIQYLIDELNDLPASADGNQSYNRYAAANSQLVSLQAEESAMRIKLSPEDKSFLAFARGVAGDVKQERNKGRRYQANAGAPVANRNSRDLTPYEQESYNQCIRAISVMTTDEKSRQNTAKSIVKFGSGDGRTVQALSTNHPAKQALWSEYTKRADVTSAAECERLINKLKSEKNPIHSEVIHLKYLVDKVMPELQTLGANNRVDTSKSYNVLQASKPEAEKIIEKHRVELETRKSAEDNKTA